MIPSQLVRSILKNVPLPGQIRRPLLDRLDPYIAYGKPNKPLAFAGPKRLFIIHDAREYIQRNIYFLNYYEIRETNFIRNILRPGGVFVDVGANIGWFTVLASKCVGPTGRVFAFEPSERIYRHLCENTAVNCCDNVTVERLALSDKNGTAVLANTNRTNDGMGSIIERGLQGEEVATVTLDDYMSILGDKSIDLIKLDVEGAELMALRGMRQLLAAGRIKHIVFEFHRGQQQEAGLEGGEMFELLRQFGFNFHGLSYRGATKILPPESELIYTNVVASCD